MCHSQVPYLERSGYIDTSVCFRPNYIIGIPISIVCFWYVLVKERETLPPIPMIGANEWHFTLNIGTSLYVNPRWVYIERFDIGIVESSEIVYFHLLEPTKCSTSKHERGKGISIITSTSKAFYYVVVMYSIYHKEWRFWTSFVIQLRIYFILTYTNGQQYQTFGDIPKQSDGNSTIFLFKWKNWLEVHNL